MDRITRSPLLAYRHDDHSEHGEDGIIRELSRRLGMGPGWFCEFGAWDGRRMSNTYSLLERGWRGVMIEGDPRRFRRLRRLADRYPGRLHTVEAYVSPADGPASLDAILASTPIPVDFDVLSIDIDGEDWHVWRSLSTYRPRIVVIEVNSAYGPGESRVHGPGNQGSSFAATVELGREKGYTAVCHTGNLFFVRDDLVDRVQLPSEVVRRPEVLFVWDWVSGPRRRDRLAGLARRLARVARRARGGRSGSPMP